MSGVNGAGQSYSSGHAEIEGEESSNSWYRRDWCWIGSNGSNGWNGWKKILKDSIIPDHGSNW